MEPNTVASLVNLGAAGAVIIIVYYLVSTFLKFIRERDAEWRSYFTELNRANCSDAAVRLELTKKILELVQAVLHELQEHDAKVDKRIADASKATVDAVNKTQNGK